MIQILTRSGLKTVDMGAFDDETFDPVGASVNAKKRSKPELVSAVGWLHRCIHLRANAVMTMPFVISKNGKVIYHSNSPVRPPELAWMASFRQLLYRTEASLCINNRAYWFVKQTTSTPLQLKYMASRTIEEQWDKTLGLTGYLRKIDGAVLGQPLSLEDVVCFHVLDPENETTVMASPVDAALAAAGVLKSVDDFTSTFFDRGAIKATILTVEGNPSPKELRRLETWWRRFFQGVRQAWEAAAVRASVKPVVVGEGLESLTNTMLTNEKRNDIATTLGVPHSMVQSNAATYATALQDRRAFYDDTILPEITLIEEPLQLELFERFKYTFRFLPEELPIYQEDEEQRALAWRNYVDGGVKPSIAARMLGLNMPEGVKVEDLDERIIPVQVAPQMSPKQSANQTVTEARSANVNREATRLKSWLKNRKAPNLAEFHSDILSPNEIKQIAAGVKFAPYSRTEAALKLVTDTQEIQDDPERLIQEFDQLFPDYRGLLDA